MIKKNFNLLNFMFWAFASLVCSIPVIFLYPLSIIFVFLFAVLFIAVKLSKNKTVKFFLFSIFAFIAVVFIVLSVIYLKINLNLNEELKNSGSNKMSCCQIFFNDFYKYLGKNNKILYLNKEYKYEANSRKKDKKVDQNGKTIFDVTYGIDKFGNRYTKCNAEAKDTYVFLGCSFVFGIGINDDDTLPYYFSKLLNFDSNVVNASFPGGGIHTALKKLKDPEFKKTLNGKKIKYVFCNLLPDHQYRAFVGRFQNTVFRKKQNKITEQKKNIFLKSKMLDTLILNNKTFILFNLFYEKKSMDLMFSLMEETDRTVKNSYNAKFVLFTTDADKYTARIGKYCKDNGIDFIKINLDYFSKPQGYYNIIGDYHPTGNANKEIAQEIYNHIKENL